MKEKPKPPKTFRNNGIPARTLDRGGRKFDRIPGNKRRAFFEADGAGRCTMVNKLFAQILGYLPENMHATNLQDLFTPESYREFEMFCHILIRENLSPQVFLVDMVCKNHRKKSMELNISVRRDARGDVVGCLAIASNATKDE